MGWAGLDGTGSDEPVGSTMKDVADGQNVSRGKVAWAENVQLEV